MAPSDRPQLTDTLQASLHLQLGTYLALTGSDPDDPADLAVPILSGQKQNS